MNIKNRFLSGLMMTGLVVGIGFILPVSVNADDEHNNSRYEYQWDSNNYWQKDSHMEEWKNWSNDWKKGLREENKKSYNGEQRSFPYVKHADFKEHFNKDYGPYSQMGEKMDREFIEEMIPHHKMALAMAEVEISKGTDPEVKAMAEKIKSKQAAEIEQLKNWYKQWYGEDPKEKSMDMSMVEELKNSPHVDMMFLEMMIPHHEEAIKMAKKELMMGKRQELKDFAQMTINEQQKEIEEMEHMLEEMEDSH